MLGCRWDDVFLGYLAKGSLPSLATSTAKSRFHTRFYTSICKIRDWVRADEILAGRISGSRRPILSPMARGQLLFAVPRTVSISPSQANGEGRGLTYRTWWGGDSFRERWHGVAWGHHSYPWLLQTRWHRPVRATAWGLELFWQPSLGNLDPVVFF